MKKLTAVLALLVFCITKVSAQENIKVLMVLTSHDKLGVTGKKTGFWIEEFVTPYFYLKIEDRYYDPERRSSAN